MAYNEKLYLRIKEALAAVPLVEEKKMFRGITFMVDGKMCISVGNDEMMCRIDPQVHETAIAKKGCSTVYMKGRPYIGYVHVSPEGIKTKKDFDYFISLSLAFNKNAKASVKRKKQ